MKDAFGLLKQIEAPNVLDAATGRGDFITILKQNLKSYVQIIGIDVSEKSVDHAQKRFPENDVEIYRMDLEALEFEDASFDLVTLANSLHHLEHQERVFAELLRVLKPGGRLVLVEMYRDGEQTEPQITHILMHHWLAAIDRRFGINHQETFTREQILASFAKLKLNQVKQVDFYLPVDNPKEASNCAHLKHNCTETFKRLESLESAEDLLDEGKRLVERINSVGCAGASSLLLCGTKKNVKPKEKK